MAAPKKKSVISLLKTKLNGTIYYIFTRLNYSSAIFKIVKYYRYRVNTGVNTFVLRRAKDIWTKSQQQQCRDTPGLPRHLRTDKSDQASYF